MNEYVVCLLFPPDLQFILLQKKEKTAYKGQYNGVGGKLAADETPSHCVGRKLKEEAGIKALLARRLLGSITLPVDCAESKPVPSTIHFYAGLMANPTAWIQPAGKEQLTLMSLDYLLKEKEGSLAGDGIVAYFIRRAMQTFDAAEGGFLCQKEDME